MDGLLHYQKQIDLSNSSPEEIVVCLGSECDSLLLKRLRNAVQTAGGSMSEVSWGVGGSQEVAVYEIVLPLGQLIATAETYVGLSLRGPVLLVNEITRAVSRA